MINSFLTQAYTRLLRPILFRLGDSPEAPHELMLGILQRFRWLRGWGSKLSGLPAHPITIAGIRFPGRVGLAAGADKDGVAAATWPALGFGFVELGTVTPKPQPGNDRPRLFRLPNSAAIINRMGFNNAGASALAGRLAALGFRRCANRYPVGISLGKQKETPAHLAVADYVACARETEPYADYFAINVSSPNTPGLRELQEQTFIADVVTALRTAAPETPVFIKLTCDLQPEGLPSLVAAATEAGAAGWIASNTTISRQGLTELDESTAPATGGMSGAPITQPARQFVAHLRTLTDLPIIGVGGIMTTQDARAMFAAGADLIQIYTGFIYSGVGLIRAINQEVS